jgi:3-hydroxy-9,10-secoandrosta-1,3,5(10)-triene-9,17-dione monooxygenase
MATSTKAKTPQVTRQELVQRARAMIPRLMERAPRAEELRTLPEETVRELHESGLLRVLQPRRFGGFETDLMTLIEVTTALGEGCGSTSWVYANLASHHWMLGMWCDEAQQEIWGENPDVGISSSFAFPAGRGRKVPGGYRITGRWPFSSGVDCSDWVMLGAIVEETGDGKPGHRVFLVPKRELEVIDNWFVTGLTATGSKDVKAQEAFVPDYRTVDPVDWRGGKSPGSEVNPGPLYRIPVLASFGFILTGTTLGLAKAAWRLYTETTRTRLATYTGANVADFPTVQIKVGEAATLIDLSRIVLLKDAEEMMGHAERGEVPDLDARHRYRRNGTYTVKLCVDAVDLVVRATGAKSLFVENPLQRIFRDIHAASAHINLNWEITAVSYGRISLGLPPDNPMV